MILTVIMKTALSREIYVIKLIEATLASIEMANFRVNRYKAA